MNIRTKPRKNPAWLLNVARALGALRRKFSEFQRLRRTGLHLRASFWCAWYLKE